jgi:hypothetical protein
MFLLILADFGIFLVYSILFHGFARFNLTSFLLLLPLRSPLTTHIVVSFNLAGLVEKSGWHRIVHSTKRPTTYPKRQQIYHYPLLNL